MLGAQALRTKQKAEQKEKEKRHRERLQSIQIEREKMIRAARDEVAELTEEAKMLSISRDYLRRDSLRTEKDKRSPSHRGSCDIPTPRHRLSLNTNHLHLLHPIPPKRPSLREHGPQRSTSSDYCRVEKKESGNRFMKWLGFGGDKKSKRRMSTV